ncbi:hypothetical protein GCM10009678_93540 [Actinomadura kijaniata]
MAFIADSSRLAVSASVVATRTANAAAETSAAAGPSRSANGTGGGCWPAANHAQVLSKIR